MKDLLENLKQTVITEIGANEISYKTYLKEHKIVVTIVASKADEAGTVNVKEIAVGKTTPRKRRVPQLSKEDKTHIKVAKKQLKSISNAVYLFTLLVRVKETLEGINVTELNPEGAKTLLTEIAEVHECLGKVSNRLIEKSKREVE